MKKTTIEKFYILPIILLLGLWGAVNMLQMEHESIASNDSTIHKLLLGFLFILTGGYLLFNHRYVKIGNVGKWLCPLIIYMACARVAALPNMVGILSYIYQPMVDIIVFILYMFAIAVANKSQEMRDFFSSWIFIGMLIIAYVFLQNWRFVNETGEYHMGTAYWILFLLPVLLYSPQKWLKYAGIVLVGSILFASFKRGGILAFGMGLIAYLFVQEVLISRKFTKLLLFIAAIVVLTIIFLFVDNALGNLFTERFLSIKDDGGSNRDLVWTTTWQMIQYSDFEHLLFGHGYSSLSINSPLGLSAHNDFLESIYDYGILGSIFYFGLHISLIKQLTHNIHLRNKDAGIMAFTYTFFFILSMISHVLIYPWLAFMVLSWGLGSASEQKALSA